MNLLLFEAHELDGSRRLILSGRRAEHLRGVLRVKNGDRLRVGALDGAKGWAEVATVSGNCIELELENENWRASSDTSAAPLRLIMALPRPQSFKKVLQTAASMDVAEISFINSARVEQSFFRSPVFEPEQIREHLLLGLEQAGKTRLPIVKIYKDFTPAKKESEVPQSLMESMEWAEFRGVPEPKAERSFAQMATEGGLRKNSRALFLIGPEGGWRQAELDFWASQGFTAFSLGNWILRVETALSVLIGQLEVVRELSRQY